jgi:16S rRNA processing protein RimM
VLSAEVPDDEVPEDPEEFFDHQLRGLAVVDTRGTAIGVVDDVVHLPGQDLISVRREGGREVLVPFVAELVPEIDVDAGRIVIDPPPGLLNLDELDPVAEPTGDPAGE